MDDITRYNALAARYRSVVGENEELRQLVDLIKENQELKETCSNIPVVSPPPPRAVARRLFEDDSGAPRRHYERWRPQGVSLFPEPVSPVALTGSPGDLVPVFYSPQPDPVDRRRRVVPVATNASPPARGCFIPVSVLKEPRFAHLVGGQQDLYHKYYALDLTALKDKPTVQSELAGKYFAPALPSTPQSPTVAMAPVLTTPPSHTLAMGPVLSTPPSHTVAMGPVLSTPPSHTLAMGPVLSTPQSPTVAMGPVLTTPPSHTVAMAPVLASSPQSPTVAMAPVLASSLQSHPVAVSPVLTVAQQSPTGSLDASRYYTAVTSLSQHTPTGDLASVLATPPQSPTGDLDISPKYFAVSPSQQIPSGGLDLSGRYFAPILSSSQQSPTDDQDLSAAYFAPVLSPSQQSPAGGLDLSGKYFGPVATSRPFSDQETSGHVPFKGAGVFPEGIPRVADQDGSWSSTPLQTYPQAVRFSSNVTGQPFSFATPPQRALAAAALSPRSTQRRTVLSGPGQEFSFRGAFPSGPQLSQAGSVFSPAPTALPKRQRLVCATPGSAMVPPPALPMSALESPFNPPAIPVAGPQAVLAAPRAAIPPLVLPGPGAAGRWSGFDPYAPAMSPRRQRFVFPRGQRFVALSENSAGALPSPAQLSQLEAVFGSEPALPQDALGPVFIPAPVPSPRKGRFLFPTPDTSWSSLSTPNAADLASPFSPAAAPKRGRFLFPTPDTSWSSLASLNLEDLDSPFSSPSTSAPPYPTLNQVFPDNAAAAAAAAAAVPATYARAVSPPGAAAADYSWSPLPDPNTIEWDFPCVPEMIASLPSPTPRLMVEHIPLPSAQYPSQGRPANVTAFSFSPREVFRAPTSPDPVGALPSLDELNFENISALASMYVNQYVPAPAPAPAPPLPSPTQLQASLPNISFGPLDVFPIFPVIGQDVPIPVGPPPNVNAYSWTPYCPSPMRVSQDASVFSPSQDSRRSSSGPLRLAQLVPGSVTSPGAAFQFSGQQDPGQCPFGSFRASGVNAVFGHSVGTPPPSPAFPMESMYFAGAPQNAPVPGSGGFTYSVSSQDSRRSSSGPLRLSQLVPGSVTSPGAAFQFSGPQQDPAQCPFGSLRASGVQSVFGHSAGTPPPSPVFPMDSMYFAGAQQSGAAPQFVAGSFAGADAMGQPFTVASYADGADQAYVPGPADGLGQRLLPPGPIGRGFTESAPLNFLPNQSFVSRPLSAPPILLGPNVGFGQMYPSSPQRPVSAFEDLSNLPPPILASTPILSPASSVRRARPPPLQLTPPGQMTFDFPPVRMRQPRDAGAYFTPPKAPEVVPKSHRGADRQAMSIRVGTSKPPKESKNATMQRIVGEIAFQLDRRILSVVFPDRVRLYGFNVRDIPDKLAQSASDSQSGLTNEQRASYLERYKNLSARLKPLGYDPNIHPSFIEHIVNTYGILRERPDSTGFEADAYNSVEYLRSIVHQMVPEENRADCMMLLNCLHLLSQDDGKPMFIW